MCTLWNLCGNSVFSNIDITQICKEDPCEEGEVLLQPLYELNGLTTDLNKQTYLKKPDDTIDNAL